MYPSLFPASITQSQSAFTFNILDNFLIDALEYKTSAMSFYQKLCLHDKKDHYYELMWVSRIWRDLVNGIRFGFAHESDRSPGPGDLALYCPAYSQPGINLPSSWKDTYDSWLVMQRYVVDGNFTAQHMKIKTPEDDVSLADGKGYMVTEGPYQSHIIESVEEKEKSSCSNHHAVNAANIQRSNLRATGVGAIACARHGCFVPHAVVDFQKGERYVVTLLYYDLRLTTGVFTSMNRFSLNFITGAGHIDGEILETLWVPFNKISPTARSMTLSHRQEVLDDHMRDSNWKKLVKIGKSPLLTSEMSTSTNGTLQKSNYYLKNTQGPYEELMKSLNQANVQKWKKEAELAALDRSELLDIYQLKIDKEDPTASQRTLMEEKRQKLLSCINKFHKTALVMTNGMEFEGEEGLHQDDPELCLGEADGSNFPGIEELGEESILDLGDDADSPAEVAELWMPSWGTSDPIMNDVVIQLRQEELELQKALKAEDLIVSKEVTEENRHGQGSDRLAWFWRINSAEDSQKIYRVNWLKAKARYDRWSEELKLVQHEMCWTVQWFQNQESEWRARADESIKNGHRAYAEKQASMWAEFAAEGIKSFEEKWGMTS
ncbi:uncharacterized protein F5147DRAFT_651355 [Suillus discolor]|uniref:CxC2-like cysteine cluster KDZ transposase-associated domain-containing protein n=1 Tax=Suillus discolor TaxID=1912936 RepID=A0A9P7FBL5_9AGAM|nr:uncharacterized protein F5147DRAFT_651355 [Suillus discolor]KAG2111729.1 hypothetical protein F5147DRAFT_651355 [Suillus discolor]